MFTWLHTRRLVGYKIDSDFIIIWVIYIVRRDASIVDFDRKVGERHRE